MIDEITAGLVLGAVSQIPQWLSGNEQEKKALLMERNLRRPQYEIPESQRRSLMSAEEQSKMTRLPGQSGIEGRLDQSTANTLAMLERLGSGGSGMINTAGRAYGNQMDAENELGIKASDMYLRNQDILRNELSKMGEYENRAWEWNEMRPYIEKANAISALKEGGMRNKDAAWKNIFGMGSSYLLNSATGGGGGLDWLNALTGGGGGTSGGLDIPTYKNTQYIDYNGRDAFNKRPTKSIIETWNK